MKNLIWIVLLFAGCSHDLRVYSDYDRDFDIKTYKTYQWTVQKDIEVKNNPLYFNELTDKRIKKITNDQLQGKGFTLTEQEPDVVLHYHIIVNDKYSMAPDPYGMYGPYWTRGRGNIFQYQEGTLIIDMMDRRTNNLAWRGYAVSVFSDYSEEITEEMLIKAIVRIFEEFPPRSRR